LFDRGQRQKRGKEKGRGKKREERKGEKGRKGQRKGDILLFPLAFITLCVVEQ